MRKIFTSFVVAGMLMMAVPVSAQFKAGVTAGLNITTMHYGDGYGTVKDVTGKMKNQAGFHFGATAVYTIPRSIIGFDLSALYDQRSAKTDNESYYPIETIKSQNILVPLNVRVRLYDYAGIVQWFVYGGPQIGFNLSKKGQFIASGKNAAGDAMELQWTPSNQTVSLNLGVGVVAMDHVQVKIGYNLLLGKSGEFERVNLTTGDVRELCSTRAHSCQVSVSYFF